MSLVANLKVENNGEMWAWCPACGKQIEVWEDEYYQTLDDGNKEYDVTCSCGESFYASESYYN